ncbi:hypothetical protein I4U23_021883 [Adineta vaga]|nr:hypothetical protein I4U23_021883 [Adineta vaga]
MRRRQRMSVMVEYISSAMSDDYCHRGSGPSGKPKLHFIQYNSQQAARDGAFHAGGKNEPAHHAHPKEGKAHYHAADKSGNIIKDGVHHCYG